MAPLEEVGFLLNVFFHVTLGEAMVTIQFHNGIKIVEEKEIEL